MQSQHTLFPDKRGRNLKHKIPINCITLARIEVGELHAMWIPEILNVFSTKEFFGNTGCPLLQLLLPCGLNFCPKLCRNVFMTYKKYNDYTFTGKSDETHGVIDCFPGRIS